MSLELLLDLRSEHAFDASPLRHDLGVYHVPFEELAPDAAPERLLAGATRRGERVAVVGRSGSGKSSLIEHVLGPAAVGVAPIALPVFGEPATVVRSVQAVAGLLIQTLADHAALDEAEAKAAVEAAGPHRAVLRAGRIAGLTVAGGWMGAELRAEVRRQAPPGLDLPRTAQATLEVVDNLLRAISSDDLMPILVFDDTDRWFRTVGGTVDHRDLALAFFGTVLPELRQRPAGIVIAAHETYLATEALADHLRQSIELRIDIPALPGPDALGRVLHSRVLAHTSPDEPAAAPPLSEVLDSAALAHLYRLYVEDFDFALRDVLRTVHVAVTEACDGGFDLVTRELVDRAAAW